MNLLSSILAYTARQIEALRAKNVSQDSVVSGINTRVGTAESNITTLTTRFDNNVSANSNSAETLYSGHLLDGTVTLSKSISNFDFLDIFFESPEGGSATNYGGHSERIPAVAGTYYLRTWDADPPSSDFEAQINASEQVVTISGTTFTANRNTVTTYAIAAQSSAIVNYGSYRYNISKIVGIKMGSASPAELTDLRVGANGKTYSSAGEATRLQISDVKSELANVGDDTGVTYIYPVMANGTPPNPGNTTAIRSSSLIPIKDGDIIEILTDRPNTSGYHYGFSNVWYNSSGTQIGGTDYPNGLQTFVVSNSSAKYFNFAMVEKSDSGNTYNPLRIADLTNYHFWIKKTSGKSIRSLKDAEDNDVPTLRNGSIGNPGNANSIAMYYPYKVSPFKKMQLEYLGDIDDTDILSWTIYLFKEAAAGIKTESALAHQIKSTTIETEAGVKHLDISEYVQSSSLAAYIGVAVGRKNASGTDIPLRVADVGNAIKVRNFYENALAEKLQTLYPREPFFYLGDKGKFTFKDDPIFSNSTGRCAWKFSTTLAFKPPAASGTKAVDMTELTTALGSNDTVTDDQGVKWVSIRVGYALVYDYAADTWKTVQINGNRKLADTEYPVLMFWSGQSVGGMLYSKFMNDIMQRNLDNASATIGQRAIVNAEVDHKLADAQHIAHPYNVTPAAQLTLLHFSDIHGDSAAMSRILADKNAFTCDVDDVICTGDIVANTAAEISSWWDTSVLTCIGNHDSASYDSSTGYNWTALSMADRDAYYIAPFENNWDIEHESGTSYYYKDYTDQNVRMIVMDSMLYTDNGAEATAQTNWLIGLLSDAIANSLHVLIAIHGPHGGASPTDCSFSKYGEVTMPTQSDCNTPQIVIDTVANAISNGLIFIGYIVGHTHQDNIWDAENDGTQMMYCVTCAAVSYAPQWMNSDQNRSTAEDAYNLITIDTNHTLIKIIRGGGADIDDHMRTRKAICFNYSTGELVGEVL